MKIACYNGNDRCCPQENCRLLSKVQAQESVIEGLREERQLWGRELAHQGATLAQDRGRLEAQVDALSEEVKSTREQLQREREALRIKEKQASFQWLVFIFDWMRGSNSSTQ